MLNVNFCSIIINFYVLFFLVSWLSGCNVCRRWNVVWNDVFSNLYVGTARSVEDETRNAELNGNRNPEWWGYFSQQVKVEKIKFLGISRYKVEMGFWLDSNSEVSCGTNSNWDFCLIWICSWLKSPHHSGFRLPFNPAFRVSSSTERAVVDVPFFWFLVCYVATQLATPLQQHQVLQARVVHSHTLYF